MIKVKRILLIAALVIASLSEAQDGPRNTKPANKAADAARNLAARLAGVPSTDFKRACNHDRDMRFDRSGRPLYACSHTPVHILGFDPDNPSGSPSATRPLEETFRLHSRPGATKVIYLDFTGHRTTGTIWNANFADGADIVTPPLDMDGDPLSFSDGERTAIQAVWRMVAEDFAAWDVDVTTEDPGIEALRRTSSSDSRHGVRCVFGGSSYDWLGSGAGGVAYVGTFGGTVTATGAENDVPCFVFPAQLGWGYKAMAEAGSHEIGHTLGLYHSGQTNGTEYYAGHGDWAPIMGVGYYRSVTQWTKGDYPLSNNSQEQVGLISNRIARRADDHGGTASSATQVSGDLMQVTGVVSQASDNDWFKFTTGAGRIDIEGTVVDPSPNLKLALTLLDQAGQVVARGAVDAGMGTGLSLEAPAGTYYLVVDGVGSGTASTGFTDYASLGHYALAGVWSPGEPVNQPPQAVIEVSATSGVAPLTVNFKGSNSTDPDGTVASYLWNFGDGGTSSLPDPTYVYASPGNHTATLTVTDSAGASHTASVLIAVASAPTDKISRVSAMTARWVPTNRSSGQFQCTVTVTDGDGKPLTRAAVSAGYSGLATGTATAFTSKQGQVSFTTSRLPSSATGQITFSVTNVSLNGYVYSPGLNAVTSVTVSR